MPEYDAFGRPVEEDASTADWTPAVPVADAERPAPPRRRRRSPKVWLWVAEAVVVLGIGVAVFVVADETRETVTTVRDGLEAFDPSGEVVGPGAENGEESDVPPPRVAPRRPFTPDGLRASLRIIKRETPGRLHNLSMRTDSISYQVQDGRKYVIATLGSEAEVPDVHVEQDRDPSPFPTLAIGAVDVTGPARLARAAGARLDKARADVDYFVLDTDDGGWNVYFKGGRYAIGDARGRLVRIY